MYQGYYVDSTLTTLVSQAKTYFPVRQLTFSIQNKICKFLFPKCLFDFTIRFCVLAECHS